MIFLINQKNGTKYCKKYILGNLIFFFDSLKSDYFIFGMTKYINYIISIFQLTYFSN